MEISFIIPLYNRLDLTQPCIESLRATIPANLGHEIILADDGSTDGTREWLAALPTTPFVVLPAESNRGYAHANNRAAHVARGRFLVLLNNDLTFKPGWLEPMLAAFTRFPDTGIVGNIQYRAADGRLDHAGLMINLKGKPEHIDHTHAPTLWTRRYSEHQAVTGACCALPRDLFHRLGGFDEQFVNGGEDVDLCYRIRHDGMRVRVAHRSRIRHWVSASPGRGAHGERNSWRLARKWRGQLIADGAAAWPRNYLHEHWLEPRDFDHGLLAAALPRILRLTRHPAQVAFAIVERNMALEEERWRRILPAGETTP